MTKLVTWFTTRKMGWGKVIIFAVLTAILTAVLNLIPALEDTSFQDIAISFECWILFAMYIIMNCEKWYEAMLKTFVFFLISQPLIYLIEVPFNSMGFGLFQYYGHWFRITLLTLPGSVIAFLVKRKSWLSVIVLSVADCMLAYLGAMYFWDMRWDFPHHLLSTVFCVLLALFFIFALLDKKSHRAVAVIIFAAALIIGLIVQKPDSVEEFDLPEGEWTYTVDNGSIADVNVSGDGHAVIKAKANGNDIITFTDGENTIEYHVSVSGGGVYVSEIS